MLSSLQAVAATSSSSTLGSLDLIAADIDRDSNPTTKRRITIDSPLPTCCMRRARVPAGEDHMLSSLPAVAAASSSTALGSKQYAPTGGS